MSMVFSTILPAVSTIRDTCVVLVLQGTRSQYPPSIPEVGVSRPILTPAFAQVAEPETSPLECFSNRRHCTLWFEISAQQLQILAFNEARFLLSMFYAPYALFFGMLLVFFCAFQASFRVAKCPVRNVCQWKVL